MSGWGAAAEQAAQVQQAEQGLPEQGVHADLLLAEPEGGLAKAAEEAQQQDHGSAAAAG